MTGFVGANGAGKTTTMRMVMGVLGIDEGRGAVAGPADHPAGPPPFGYMPEERGLYPKQPILDQLVYVAQLKGMDRAAGPHPGDRAAGAVRSRRPDQGPPGEAVAGQPAAGADHRLGAAHARPR